MFRSKNLFFKILLIVIFSFLPTIVVATTSVTVTMIVRDTTVTFSGYSSPQSTILIQRDGVVISTVLTDENGYFYRKIEAQTPNIYKFSLFSTDRNNNISPKLEYNIALISHTDTHIQNIVFPPTINMDVVKTNRFVHISGFSVPNSEVILNVHNYSDRVRVRSDGSWSYNLYLDNLRVGLNIVKTATILESGLQSAESFPLAIYLEPKHFRDDSEIPLPLETEYVYLDEKIAIQRSIETDFECCPPYSIDEGRIYGIHYIYFLILLIILIKLVFILFFLLLKRRKKKDEEEENN